MSQQPERSVRLICCLTLSIALAGCDAPIQSSPHEWNNFVKTNGHANEIPTTWLETPAGKFAHGIKIPNPVSADSGYKWTMSSKEYFDHLCEKESGNFVFKTIENVEGFVMLRTLIGNSVEQQKDRWWQEAPGMTGRKSLRYDPSWDAAAYVDPPHYTYEYVEYPAIEGSGYTAYAGKLPGLGKWRTVSTHTTPKSRYGVIWRGIRREHDRQHLISGYEWIALDLQTNEVLAVLRDFNQTGAVKHHKEGINWAISTNCPSMDDVVGKLSTLFEVEKTWIPRVLKPSIYPKLLENADRLKEQQRKQELDYQKYLEDKKAKRK